MNGDKDELGRSLGREFHGQVDRINDAPITLDAVRGTARTIRRRRTVGAGVAALAAVAIIVPVGMLGAGAFNNADNEPLPATNSPSLDPTRNATQDPTGAPTTREPADEPAVLDPAATTGPDPSVTYITGNELVLTSGERITLAHDYESFAPAGDEFVGIWGQSSGEGKVDVLADDGTVVESSTGESYSVSSTDGTVATWITADGEIMTRASGETVAINQLEHGSYAVNAASGSRDCSATSGEGGCSVYFQPFSEGGEALVATKEKIGSAPGDLMDVRDVSPDGLLSGLISGSDQDPSVPVTSAIFDATSDTMIARVDNLVFDYAASAGFSPDGQAVVARRHEEAGPTDLEVLDTSNGESLLTIKLAAETADTTDVISTAWEGDSHLLVVTDVPTGDDMTAYNLYRVGMDGTVERILEKDKVPDNMTVPWIFAS